MIVTTMTPVIVTTAMMTKLNVTMTIIVFGLIFKLTDRRLITSIVWTDEHKLLGL